MKEVLGTVWTGTYGLAGAICMYAHNVVAGLVTRVFLADAATITKEAQAYVSFASAAGGFIIVILSIVSLSLKIKQQRKNLAETQSE